jgi:glycoprotein endo-alpha-1,2-mannosidase
VPDRRCALPATVKRANICVTSKLSGCLGDMWTPGAVEQGGSSLLWLSFSRGEGRPGRRSPRLPPRDRASCRFFFAGFFGVAAVTTLSHVAWTADVAPEVLAFYYGWYGNPQLSGEWRHWKNVDPANERIEGVTDYPAGGTYDSHDPAVVDRQAETAHMVGISGFIASWWGRDSFEDRGMPLLLAAAGKHKLAVSAYYEVIAGEDEANRVKAAVHDIDYLLSRYGGDGAWLRANGKPVLFVYGRALHGLSPADWREVLAQVWRNNPSGAVLIADSLDPQLVSLFDGASTYNITGQTQHKAPPEIRAWAHNAYPRMVAAAGPGKISTVTVIPGYDDRNTGRPPPRPITDRWGGETYRVLWQEAIAAAPDYVLITSWNEWHEGSELEPSVEYGSTILDKTTAFSREFLARKK